MIVATMIQIMPVEESRFAHAGVGLLRIFSPTWGRVHHRAIVLIGILTMMATTRRAIVDGRLRLNRLEIPDKIASS